MERRGREAALCNVLVVEEVFANGYARVVYSIGTSESLGIGIPTFFRATGRIADGVLRFRLPVPGRPALAYRFDTDQLVGTFNDAGRATLSRPGTSPRSTAAEPISAGPSHRRRGSATG